MRKKDGESSRQILYVSVGIVILLVAGFSGYTAIFAKKSQQNPSPTAPTQALEWSDLDEGWEQEDGPTQNEDDRYNEEYQQEVALRQPEERLQLTCDDVAVYSGAYVEDGSDEPVEDVASILITNRSGKYLTFARLTYQLDGETAVFEVSDLPTGKSVWILEKNRRKATENSKFVYQEATTAFSDHMTRSPKELKVEYADAMLRVTNVSDRALDHVIVHYKSIHKDGHYLGGITYRLEFGTLQPGDSVEKIAGHYDNDWSMILRTSYEEVANDS